MERSGIHRMLIFFLLLVCIAVFIPTISHATYIFETESNDSFATAQSVDGAFSIGFDPDIFNSTSFWHASVLALYGRTHDVDYYAFTVGSTGVQGFFDIDYGDDNDGSNVNTTMALFDSGYNVLAYSDISASDPGSIENNTNIGWTSDSFLGTYTFFSAGTYYLAVSTWPNSPYSLGDGVGEMTRPDGKFGGILYSGSGSTSMDNRRGGSSSGTYGVHLSLNSINSSPAPVPEPATITILLSGLGLLSMGAYIRKKTFVK